MNQGGGEAGVGAGATLRHSAEHHGTAQLTTPQHLPQATTTRHTTPVPGEIFLRPSAPEKSPAVAAAGQGAPIYYVTLGLLAREVEDVDGHVQWTWQWDYQGISL
jgi:hypothetical protein